MIITLENRGTPDQPRFVLMNSYGWVWDEQKQEFVEEGGTLYHDPAEAGKVYRKVLLAKMKEEGLKPARKFVAPIYIEIYTTEEIDQHVIEDWCQKATRFIIHADQHGLGPVNDSVGMLTVDWGQLQELKSEEKTCG